MNGRRKALAYMALKLASDVLRTESEWQNHKSSNASTYDAMCEIESFANWYRRCIAAIGNGDDSA